MEHIIGFLVLSIITAAFIFGFNKKSKFAKKLEESEENEPYNLKNKYKLRDADKKLKVNLRKNDSAK